MNDLLQDNIINICQYLDIKSIGHLSKTCKKYMFLVDMQYMVRCDGYNNIYFGDHTRLYRIIKKNSLTFIYCKNSNAISGCGYFCSEHMTYGFMRIDGLYKRFDYVINGRYISSAIDNNKFINECHKIKNNLDKEVYDFIFNDTKNMIIRKEFKIPELKPWNVLRNDLPLTVKRYNI